MQRCRQPLHNRLCCVKLRAVGTPYPHFQLGPTWVWLDFLLDRLFGIGIYNLLKDSLPSAHRVIVQPCCSALLLQQRHELACQQQWHWRLGVWDAAAQLPGRVLGSSPI